MEKSKLKPVHLIHLIWNGTFDSREPNVIDNEFYFHTYCGITRHRVYASWTLKDVTCTNCLKTKRVRKQIVNRLLK